MISKRTLLSHKSTTAGVLLGVVLLSGIGVGAATAAVKHDTASQFTTGPAAARLSAAGGLAAVRASEQQSPPALKLPVMPSVIDGQRAAAQANPDGAGAGAPITGIFNETHDSPFPPGVVQVSNKWIGSINGVTTYAIAGEDLETNEGAIGIFTAPARITDVSQIKLTGLYDEAGTTSVTITAVSGVNLTLSRVGGTGSLSFNMVTHAFQPA